jgi:hypothetical protein
MLPLIRDWNSEVLFPGFLAIGLGLIGFFAAIRTSSQSSAPARVSPDRETALFYGSLGVLAFWLSLGPRAGLYTLFYYTIPVFSLLRAPGRIGPVVILVLAILAAFAVRAVRRRFTGWRACAVAIACCAAALAELNQVPFGWRLSHPIPAPYRVLAQLPRGAVAEFPFFEQRVDFHIHTIYMLNSTVHWQPLVNGYSDHIPQDFRDDAVGLASFPSRESFEILRKRRVRYVTIHRDLYGRQRAPEIEARLVQYSPYLRLLARDDRMLLFEVVAWPR